MASPATLKDVAAAAGVSVSTASRVMRGDLGWVGVATADRVRDAAARLDYHPSAAAQALVRGRTNTVGIAYQYPHLGHHAPMLARAHELVREYEHRLLHVPMHSPVDVLEELTLPLRERRVDILVLAGVLGADGMTEWPVADYQQVVAVGIAARNAPPPVIPSACWDDALGVAMAVEHVTSLGHERLLYLGAGDGAKLAAFMEAAEAAGAAATSVTCTTDIGSALMGEGARLMAEALHGPDRPTAVLARNDDLAIGALHAATERGLRVPQDISIMGYYDTPASAFTAPSLTTIVTPFATCLEAVLRPALQRANGQLETPADPERQWFAPRLVIRRSTGPAPTRLYHSMRGVST